MQPPITLIGQQGINRISFGIRVTQAHGQKVQDFICPHAYLELETKRLFIANDSGDIPSPDERSNPGDSERGEEPGIAWYAGDRSSRLTLPCTVDASSDGERSGSYVVAITPNATEPARGPATAHSQFILKDFTFLQRRTASAVSLLTDSSGCIRVRVPLGWEAVFADAEGNALCRSEIYLAVCTIDPSGDNIEWQMALELETLTQGRDAEARSEFNCPSIEVVYQKVECSDAGFICPEPLRWGLFHNRLEHFIAVYHPLRPNDSYIEPIDPQRQQDSPAVSLVEPPLKSNFVMASGRRLSFGFVWPRPWAQRKYRLRFVRMTHNSNDGSPGTPRDSHHWTITGDVRLAGTWTPGEQGHTNPDLSATPDFMILGLAGSEVLDGLTPDADNGPIFRFIHGGCLSVMNQQPASDPSKLVSEYEYTPGGGDVGPSAQHLERLKIRGETAWLRVFADTAYRMEPANECLYGTPEGTVNDNWRTGDPKRTQIGAWSHENATPLFPIAPYLGLTIGQLPDAVDFETAVITPSRVSELVKTSAVAPSGEASSGLVFSDTSKVNNRVDICLGGHLSGAGIKITCNADQAIAWNAAGKPTIVRIPASTPKKDRDITITGSIGVGAWTLPIKAGDNTFLVFKLCDRSLRSWMATATGEELKVLNLLEQLSKIDTKSNALAQRMDNPSWRGVIIVNAGVISAGEMPDSIRWVLASNDHTALQFHCPFIGFDVARSFPESARTSSFFGMVADSGTTTSIASPPTPLENEVSHDVSDPFFKYTLEKLILGFENTAVTSFSCEVTCEVGKFFGSPLLTPNETIPILTLSGRHSRATGADRYDFVLKTPQDLKVPRLNALVNILAVGVVWGTAKSVGQQETMPASLTGTTSFSFAGNVTFEGGGIFEGGTTLPFTRWGIDVAVADSEQKAATERPIVFDFAGLDLNSLAFCRNLLPVTLDGVFLATGSSWATLGYVPIGTTITPVAGFLASAPWPTRGKLAAKKNDSRVRVLVGWAAPDTDRHREHANPDAATIVKGIQFPDGPLDVGVQEIVRLQAENVQIKAINGNDTLLLSNAKLTVGRRKLLEGSAALLRRREKWAFVGYGPNHGSEDRRIQPAGKYLVSIGATWDNANSEPPTYPQTPPTDETWPDTFAIDDASKALVLVNHEVAGRTLIVRLCDTKEPLYYAEWSDLKLAYRRVSDSVSEFSFGFRPALPSQSIGPLRVTPPWVTVAYASDAAITLDIGFPYDGDFSRSAQIISSPWYGACGILIRAETGEGGGVIGVGVAIGYGFSYSAPGGILTVRGSIALYGVVWGRVQIKKPEDRPHQTPALGTAELPAFDLQSLDGFVGLRGDLHAKVNLQVASAVVDLLFDARVPFNLEGGNLSVGECTVSVSAKATVTLFAYYDFQGKKREEKVTHNYTGSFTIDRKGVGSLVAARAEDSGVPSMRFKQAFESVEKPLPEHRLSLGEVPSGEETIDVYVAPFVHAIADPRTLSGSECRTMLTLCASVEISVGEKMLAVILKAMNPDESALKPDEWRKRLAQDVSRIRRLWGGAGENPFEGEDVVKAVSKAVRIKKRESSGTRDSLKPPVDEVRVAMPISHDHQYEWRLISDRGCTMDLNKSISFDPWRFDRVDPYSDPDHTGAPQESLMAKWASFVTGFQCSCVEEALSSRPQHGEYDNSEIIRALRPSDRQPVDKLTDILKSTATKEGTSSALPLLGEPGSGDGPWASFAQCVGATVDPEDSGAPVVVFAKLSAPGRSEELVRYEFSDEDDEWQQSKQTARINFANDANRAKDVIRWAPLSLWSHVPQEYNAHLLFMADGIARYAFGQDLVSRLRLGTPQATYFTSVKGDATLTPVCVVDLDVAPVDASIGSVNGARSYVMSSVRAAEIPPIVNPVSVRVFARRGGAWLEVSSPVVRRRDLCEEEGPTPGSRGRKPATGERAGMPDAALKNDPGGFFQLCRESGRINGRGYCLDLGAERGDAVDAVMVVASLEPGEAIYANAVELTTSGADKSVETVRFRVNSEPKGEKFLLWAHAARAPAGCLGVEVLVPDAKGDKPGMPLGYHMITLMPLKNNDGKHEVDLLSWRTRPRQPIEVIDSVETGVAAYRSRVATVDDVRRYPIVVRHPDGWKDVRDGIKVRSPYKPIGQELTFAVVQEDFEGRLCDTGHGSPSRLSARGDIAEEPPRVIYHDPLIPVSEWPDVDINADVTQSAEEDITVTVTIERKPPKAESDGRDLWMVIRDQVNDERWSARIVGGEECVVTGRLRDLANRELSKDSAPVVETVAVNVTVNACKVTPVGLSLEVGRVCSDEGLFPSEVPSPVAEDEREPCKRRITRVAVNRPNGHFQSGAFAVSRDRNYGAEKLWFVGHNVLTLTTTDPTLYGLRPVVKRPVTSSRGTDVDTGIMLQRAFSAIEQFMQGPQKVLQGHGARDPVKPWNTLAGAKRNLAVSVARLVTPLFKGAGSADGSDAIAFPDDAVRTVQQAALRDLAAAFETDVLAQWGVDVPEENECEFLLRCDLSNPATLSAGGEQNAETSVRCRVRQNASCVSVPLRAVDLPANASAGVDVYPAFHLDAILHPSHGCLTLLSSLSFKGGSAFKWAAPLRRVPSGPVIRKHVAVARIRDVAKAESLSELLQWYYDVVFEVDRDEQGYTLKQDEVCVRLEVGRAKSRAEIQGGDVDANDRALADAAVKCSLADEQALPAEAEALAAALQKVVGSDVSRQGKSVAPVVDLVGECVVNVSKDDQPGSAKAVVKVNKAQLGKAGASDGDSPLAIAIARVASEAIVDWHGEWAVSRKGGSYQTTMTADSVSKNDPLGVRVVCVADRNNVVDGDKASGLNVLLWSSAKVSVRVVRNRELAGREVDDAFVFEAVSAVPSRVYPDIVHDFVRFPLKARSTPIGREQVVPGGGLSSVMDTIKTFLDGVLSSSVDNAVTIEVGVAPAWNEKSDESTEAQRKAAEEMHKALGAFPLLKMDGLSTACDEAVKTIKDNLDNVNVVADARLVMTMRVDALATAAEGSQQMNYRQVARFRRVWCEPG